MSPEHRDALRVLWKTSTGRQHCVELASTLSAEIRAQRRAYHLATDNHLRAWRVMVRTELHTEERLQASRQEDRARLLLIQIEQDLQRAVQRLLRL